MRCVRVPNGFSTRHDADPLLQLLRTLRGLEVPPTSQLGFPSLDRLLGVFQNPPQTRQQQQYHTQSGEWSTEHQNFHSTREKPLPIIEITGATACSGKTQMLCYLVSMSLLPQQYNEIPLGGKGYAVVLLDLSSKFSILRLHHLMRELVSSCSTPSALPEDEISSLISESLTHLHVFRPHSTPSLLATLSTLTSYLLKQLPAHFSSNRPVGLLSINDLSAFLWQDRLDADEEAGPYTSNNAEKANNSLLLQRYRALVSSLRHIQHQFSCTVVATNWSLSPATTAAGHRALRPHLPSVWNNFCTLKVVVEKDRVKKFGPGMSVEEAAKQAGQRWEAAERSAFSGWANWWESEKWREEVREGVRNLEREGCFSFKVTEKGVLPEEDKD